MGDGKKNCHANFINIARKALLHAGNIFFMRSRGTERYRKGQKMKRGRRSTSEKKTICMVVKMLKWRGDEAG